LIVFLTMTTYKDSIEALIKLTKITKEQIFDYSVSPYSEEFDHIYTFYSEALKRHSDYGIEPAYFFFENDTSVNAYAGVDNNIYILSIYSGTIIYLIKNIKENRTFKLSKEFCEFEGLLNTSINELMYTVAIHFTFYHELAHLIQKSKFLSFKFYERDPGILEFTERRHLLELDADQFSALCIGTHLVQYAKSTFNDNLSIKEIEKLIIIFCSACLIYILSFTTDKSELYYKEKSHPHPVIRMICVILHLVGYCQQNFNMPDFDMNKIENLIRESLIYAEDSIDKDLIQNFKAKIGGHASEIETYLTDLRRLELGDTSLAGYKWNQKIINSQNSLIS
jgi:hypothetical protein